MSAAVGERFPVRVMVTDAWDNVNVQVDGTTTVAQLKRDALRATLKQAPLDERIFVWCPLDDGFSRRRSSLRWR